MVPLSALFAKAEATNVKVSPGGKYVAWLARGEGVLNFWLAPLERSTVHGVNTRSKTKTKSSDRKSDEIRDAVSDIGGNIPGARQLTMVTDQRDVCFAYRFTHDETRIVYLRETTQGSEMYHLYSLDLTEARSEPVTSGRDMFEAYPHLTCSVGFVGGKCINIYNNLLSCL